MNAFGHGARSLEAQARWERMSLAQRAEWMLSELGRVLPDVAQRLNPENLPLSDAGPENHLADAFRLDMWGGKCTELADAIREECRVKSLLKPPGVA